jgi:hypothetical protein
MSATETVIELGAFIGARRNRSATRVREIADPASGSWCESPLRPPRTSTGPCSRPLSGATKRSISTAADDYQLQRLQYLTTSVVTRTDGLVATP